MKRSFGQYLSLLATGAICVCAILVTASVVRRDIIERERGRRFHSQKDWQKYAVAGNRMGPANAQVVLIEFADFECPACRLMAVKLRAIREAYPNDVAVVFRHYPLDIHPHAEGAAAASECAALQGRFEALHDVFFAERDSIGVRSWHRFAVRAGVSDLPAFDKCMTDSVALPAIRRDLAAAEQLGARSTPTMLVNGVRFSGSLPQAVLDSVVKSAVEAAGRGQ